MKTTVVIFIVEGKSDENALYPRLRGICKNLKIYPIVVRGDLFIHKDYERIQNPKILIDTILKERVFKDNIIRKKDVSCVIHVTDTDGSFINDYEILINKDQPESTTYTLDNIVVNSDEQKINIFKRDERRSKFINILSSQEKVSNLNYRILYFSRNMDHVITGNPDVPKDEKEAKADAFSVSFTKDSDFMLFFEDDSFNLNENYKASWDFIRRNQNSLKRYTNFGLVFEILNSL